MGCSALREPRFGVWAAHCCGLVVCLVFFLLLPPRVKVFLNVKKLPQYLAPAFCLFVFPFKNTSSNTLWDSGLLIPQKPVQCNTKAGCMLGLTSVHLFSRTGRTQWSLLSRCLDLVIWNLTSWLAVKGTKMKLWGKVRAYMRQMKDSDVPKDA